MDIQKPRKETFLFFGILPVLGLLGLSGCAVWDGLQPSHEEIDWQDEVLWMDECGLEDMRCCMDKDPVCDEGLSCCKSPIDPDETRCRPDCGCGGDGDFCCAEGDLCQDGLVCRNNVCQTCGEEEMPCCPGQACNGDLVCHQEACVSCGMAGNPCCDEEPSCARADHRDQERTECRQGVCVLCGWGGETICASVPACSPLNLANNGSCLKCGGSSEPCCRDDEASGTPYCAADGFTCQAGFCVEQAGSED